MSTRKSLAALVLTLGACAAAGPGTEQSMTTPAITASNDTVVPAGFGSLRQDEITVAIRSDAVLVKVTPLDEGVIRVVAPDTYARLSALRRSRSAEAESRTAREPELFLVSFFSYEPDVAFQPEDLQIMYQSRLLRPTSVIPLTTGWGQQRLGQQETQTAIYAFDEEFDFDQDLTVRYGMVESNEWRQILTRLENERGRILSRVR